MPGRISPRTNLSRREIPRCYSSSLPRPTLPRLRAYTSPSATVSRTRPTSRLSPRTPISSSSVSSSPNTPPPTRDTRGARFSRSRLRRPATTPFRMLFSFAVSLAFGPSPPRPSRQSTLENFRILHQHLHVIIRRRFAHHSAQNHHYHHHETYHLETLAKSHSQTLLLLLLLPNVTAVRTRSLSGANTTRTRLRETEQTLCLPKPPLLCCCYSVIKAERQNTERLLTLENTRRI